MIADRGRTAAAVRRDAARIDSHPYQRVSASARHVTAPRREDCKRRTKSGQALLVQLVELPNSQGG
jgi:hypothetical protein